MTSDELYKSIVYLACQFENYIYRLQGGIGGFHRAKGMTSWLSGTLLEVKYEPIRRKKQEARNKTNKENKKKYFK